jgi:hypothetical protein
VKVFVYRNVTKKCFSIMALEGERKGKVIAHRMFVDLTDAIFKVREAGRQRVLRTGQKNVHAGVVGQWSDTLNSILTPATTLVRYNPKVSGDFTTEDGMPVKRAKFVELSGGKYIFAGGIEQ